MTYFPLSRTYARASSFYNFAPQPPKSNSNLPNNNFPKLATPSMASFGWANDPNPLSLTHKFIVPNKHKPNLANISHFDSIPTIDMNNNNEALVHNISRACEGDGIFELINHGVPTDMCQNVLQVITAFFHLPREEKARMLSNVHTEDGKLFNYYMIDEETKEKIYMWGESFYHTWHRVDASRFIQKLPSNPPCYREIVAAYIKEISSLIKQILSLISQALGLDKDYLQRRLGENPQCTAQANYYPPCPNPELTLGLGEHTDIKMITVLLADEGVSGLQVLKAGKWYAVNPSPGALIINVANQLQVLSNGKYKSARHRVVNNSTDKRASFGIFIGLEKNAIVGPIQELVDEEKALTYHKNYTFDNESTPQVLFHKQEGSKLAYR